MALSFFSESEAPRDFRISSTDSDSNYTKCPLCYTIKKNFYCAECIRAGNFIHSSMPYSDRYAEKQAKLLKLRDYRKHCLDKCEKILQKKRKHASLELELKQCKDKVELIKLAIEQRKCNVEEKKKKLEELHQCNQELVDKLPRYQKRVANLGKHTHNQRIELENHEIEYNDSVEELAALRRARIRQLTKYIFPVYITYETCDSIEDMEFLQVDESESPAPSGERLHIVSAWLPLEPDLTHLNADAWRADPGEGGGGGGCAVAAGEAGGRARAALQLGAQLSALLAHTLHVPYALTMLPEVWSGSRGGPSAEACLRAVCAAVVCLAAVSGAGAGAGAGAGGEAEGEGGLAPPARPRRALALLHDMLLCANTDHPLLGRAEGVVGSELAAAVEAWHARWPPPPPPPRAADAEPEHLVWPDNQVEAAATPPPAPSLVTSLASMWRGWTK